MRVSRGGLGGCLERAHFDRLSERWRATADTPSPDAVRHRSTLTVERRTSAWRSRATAGLDAPEPRSRCSRSLRASPLKTRSRGDTEAQPLERAHGIPLAGCMSDDKSETDGPDRVEAPAEKEQSLAEVLKSDDDESKPDDEVIGDIIPS